MTGKDKALAKKKDVEALFEVITKSKSGGKGMPGLTIPEWMRKPVSPAAQPQVPSPTISDDLSEDDDLPPLELPPPRSATFRATPVAPVERPKPAPVMAPTPAPTVAPADEPIAPLPAPTLPAATAARPAGATGQAAQPAVVGVTTPVTRPAPRRPLRMPQMFVRKSGEQPPVEPVLPLMVRLKPVVKIENRQLSVVFSPTSVAATAGASVLLLVVMFLAGWALRGPKAPPAEGPEQSRPVANEQQPQRAAEGTSTAPPARVTGKYYMIIQGLGGKSTEDLQEAWRIQKFCSEAKCPATVSMLAGQYVIYSLTGFDKADLPEAKEYAEKIKELGKRFKTQTQGREFKQTDPQGRWPWFLKYSGPGPAAG